MNFAEVFKALGDETRLRLLNLFLQSGEKICVCEMVDALLLPQYKISKSLCMLRNAGILTATQRGTWVYYEPNPSPSKCMNDLFGLIKKHFRETYPDDLKRLNKRLALRKDGLCVLGFALKDKKAKVDLEEI